MAGVPSLVGELTFHVPHSVVMPTKKPPLCPLSCWGQHSWLFPHRVADVVCCHGEHWPRSVDHVTGVHPLKAGGGDGL